MSVRHFGTSVGTIRSCRSVLGPSVCTPYVTMARGSEAFNRVLLLDRRNTITSLILGPRHLARNDVTATRASTTLRIAYKATSPAQQHWLTCSANLICSSETYSAYSFVLTHLLSTRNAICHTLLTLLAPSDLYMLIAEREMNDDCCLDLWGL